MEDRPVLCRGPQMAVRHAGRCCVHVRRPLPLLPPPPTILAFLLEGCGVSSTRPGRQVPRLEAPPVPCPPLRRPQPAAIGSRKLPSALLDRTGAHFVLRLAPVISERLRDRHARLHRDPR